MMIGDAIPHPPSFYKFAKSWKEYDWRKEAKDLYDELGVRIYSVQVFKILAVARELALVLKKTVYSAGKLIQNRTLICQHFSHFVKYYVNN